MNALLCSVYVLCALNHLLISSSVKFVSFFLATCHNLYGDEKDEGLQVEVPIVKEGIYSSSPKRIVWVTNVKKFMLSTT